MRALLALGLLAMLGLTACGDSGSPYGGTAEPTGVKIGKPYSISGETYYPKYEPSYAEEGIASWYGPDFHARMTASGEQYDQNEYTAAHKTLPMPSMVRVTRLDNGKSVEVRINDRGPFVKGRIIDLSKAAAKEIGLDISGTTRVRVEYMPQESDSYISSMGLKAPWWGESQITTAAVPAPEVTVGDLAPTTAAIASSDLAPPSNAPQPLIAEDNVVPPAEPVIASSAPLAAPKIVPPVVVTPSVAAPVATPAVTASLDTSPQAIAKPAQMQVQMIAPAASPPVSVPATNSFGKASYRVQTGSFSNYQNAENHADSMAGVASPEIRETQINGKTFYRVSLGPVYDLGTAQVILNKAKELGHPDARLIVE